jgi:hypothetical protein
VHGFFLRVRAGGGEAGRSAAVVVNHWEPRFDAGMCVRVTRGGPTRARECAGIARERRPPATGDASFTRGMRRGLARTIHRRDRRARPSAVPRGTVWRREGNIIIIGPWRISKDASARSVTRGGGGSESGAPVAHL